MTKCRIEGCDREVKFKQKKLCGVHYHRIRAHGDPHVVKRTPTGTPLKDRVLPEENWFTVDRGYKTPCREWQRNRDSNGYGTVKFNNKSLKLHRVMYEMFVGPISEGHVVMHLCDNPPCANPEHLKAGTQNENIQDAVRKGRSSAPKNLTDEQVQEIRLRWRLGETQQKLEEEFNCGGGTVSRIMSGELYSKVPDTSADVAVNQEARVRSLDPEKKVALQECVKKKMTITEIASTIGVHHATIQKYYPGYGSWTWKAENTSLQSETTKCIFCGRVLTVQNLKRHQGSARCLKSRKEGEINA